MGRCRPERLRGLEGGPGLLPGQRPVFPEAGQELLALGFHGDDEASGEVVGALGEMGIPIGGIDFVAVALPVDDPGLFKAGPDKVQVHVPEAAAERQQLQLARGHDGIIGAGLGRGDLQLVFRLGTGRLSHPALFPLGFQVRGQHDEGVGVGEGLFQLGRSEVAPVLADGGQDFPGKPLLKGKSGRLVGTGKKEVEALLGNSKEGLETARGSNRIATLPFSRNSLKNLRHVRAGITQRLCHVLGHEPRFPVNQQAAQDGPGDRFPELVRLVVVGG